VIWGRCEGLRTEVEEVVGWGSGVKSMTVRRGGRGGGPGLEEGRVYKK